jgi:hypothetical protein
MPAIMDWAGRHEQAGLSAAAGYPCVLGFLRYKNLRETTKNGPVPRHIFKLKQ